MKIALYLVCLMCLRSVSTADECNTMKTIAQAVFSQEGNDLNMSQAFYTASQSSPSFLLVTYNFNDDIEMMSNCNVTYIWAQGGFLFIQPPSVFDLTSLQFFQKTGVEKLTLTLPYRCRHLVQDQDGCTCVNLNSSLLLKVFTQQVIIIFNMLAL